MSRNKLHLSALALVIVAGMASGTVASGAIDDAEKRLGLSIEGGFQPNDTTWVIEAGSPFDLVIDVPEAGALVLAWAPLQVWGELKPDAAELILFEKIDGDLALRNLVFSKLQVATAYVVQAFLVTPGNQVYQSEVINVYVTDYLAPMTDPKTEPSSGKQEPAKQDDHAAKS